MSIELNAANAKSIAKRIMKTKQLSVRKQFSPVISEYTLQINPKQRVNLSLTDDCFKYNLQENSGNQWQTSLTDEVNGPLDKLEQMFFGVIERCSKHINNAR